MMSKISLFNKSIYKSTVKRFLWGSVLYFIILFMCTAMPILIGMEKSPVEYDYSVILRDSYIIIPMLLTIVTPTVVGLLIFRFIHSQKCSVFFHSLPIKRETSFISSVLAGLTLMAVPIIINAVILAAISLCGYGNLFTVKDCAIWMIFNLFGIFIMFSCTCCAATLTGNSFAMVAVNAFIHCALLIFAACFGVMAEVYLFGFSNNNEAMDFIVQNTFPYILMQKSESAENIMLDLEMIKFIAASIVLYILSVILYRKRAMETAGEIAGFSCLNPIFKYIVTFLASLAAFAIFSFSLEKNRVLFWIIIVIVSLVSYFGVEMVLRKNLHVWKSSYKGFAAFLAAFAAMICIFAFTSFFGYETRIPKSADIKEAALYDFYSDDEPFVEDAEAIARIIDIHEKLIEETETEEKEASNYFHIKYRLKDGKTVHRRYGISENKYHDFMRQMYKNASYKEKNESFFSDVYKYLNASLYAQEKYVEIEDGVKVEQLVKCVQKDLSRLSYDEIHTSGWSFRIDISCMRKKDTEKNADIHYSNIRHLNKDINSNFTQTIQWIKENGYWDNVKIENTGALYIVNSFDELPFVSAGKIMPEIDLEKEKNLIKLEGEDAAMLIDYIHNGKSEWIDEKDRMYIYRVVDYKNHEYSCISAMSKEQVKALYGV